VSNPEFRRQLSEEILGPPIYTRDALMAATGAPPELGDDLWLSLGFPILADDGTVAYGESDAEALKSLNGLLALDLVQRDTLMSMTRVMGQAMARLASAQVQMFNDGLRAIVVDDAEGVDDEVRAAKARPL
jgi:adenylate cyclase